MTGTIIAFPHRYQPEVYPALVHIDGRKRRCWTVITQHSNGDWDWHGVMRGRRDAEWLAGILAANRPTYRLGATRH